MRIIIFLLLASALYAQKPDTWTKVTNGLSEAEVEAGWILLFDGEDEQEHWRSGENGSTNNWTVDDESMLTPNAYEFLFTRQEYSDFEFSATWRMNEGGNSGIFWRVMDPPGWFCSGPEYGILDEVNGGDRTEMGYHGNETDMPIKITASAYDIYVTKVDGNVDSPFVSAAYPFDEWNTGVVWANGPHHEHWLNNQKVVEYEVGTPDWQMRFETSKFWNQCSDHRDTYGKHTTGLIGMQAHGGNLYNWYRNLKVRSFTPGEQLVSPRISASINPQEQNVIISMEVAITGAKIYYTLDGSTPDETSMLYMEPFELSGNVTLKAVTTRQGFVNSEPAEDSFNIGVSVNRVTDIFYPWSIKGGGDNYYLQFKGAVPAGLLVEVLSVKGEVRQALNSNPLSSRVTLPGLAPGVNIVRVTAAGAWESRLLYRP